MWEVVKADVTMKSTLYILDAEDQLLSMKLGENEDPKTHLTEIKLHFQTMLQCRNNLMKMGSSLSDNRFNTIIMSSLPESYRPTLQTITAAERASILTGGQSAKMKHDDLIAFLIEEAQHRMINDEHMKNAEIALAAHVKRTATDELAKGRDLINWRTQIMMSLVEIAKNQDMWKPTVMQRAEEKKVKHHSRKGSLKRQRQ